MCLILIFSVSVLRQLVIVGGGIQGLITAIVAHEHGFQDIVVFDSTVPHDLGPDTLRNHSWLQSGLLYAFDALTNGDSTLSESKMRAALQMSDWGRRMVEKFQVPFPARKGVFRLSDENQAKLFLNGAEQLKIRGTVRRLEGLEPEIACGPFFEPGGVHFEVPDAPFDGALLLRRALQDANQLGIQCIAEKAEVSKGNGKHFSVQSQTNTFEAVYVVLCAGGALIEMLDRDHLDLPNRLAVYRSCLLRLRRSDALGVPLYVEIGPGRGLSIAQHLPTVVPPRGCLVIGNRDRRRLTPEEIGQRLVTEPEQKELRRFIPPSVLEGMFGDDVRFTAGHKTEALDENENASVEPWTGKWPNFPSFRAAVPGKATLALYHAERVIGSLPKPRTWRGATSALRGTRVSLARDCHHASRFDGVFDEADDNGNDEKNA